MANPEKSRQTVRALRDLGVTIALDDFGTGHSSLAVLKQMPVQRLKIDRGFLHHIPHDNVDSAIVRGVLALARTLRLTAVAEGVETAAQLDFLRRVRCPSYQGWHFAPALPAQEVLRYAAQPRHDAAANAPWLGAAALPSSV